MKYLTPAIALAALSLATAKADTLAQWTFETTANTNGLTFAPGAGNSPGTIVADSGLNSSSSFASGLHANASTYSTPAGDLDSTIAGLDSGASAADTSPSLHSFSSNGWSVGDYYSFTLSTLGYTGVTVAFDQTGSNTGPSSFAFSYSINGGSFTQFATYSLVYASWNTTTEAGNSESFTSSAFDNATSIEFRIIDLNTTSINNGTVGTGGTDRVDNFTVVTTPAPEPSTIALLTFGGVAGLLAIRRKR